MSERFFQKDIEDLVARAAAMQAYDSQKKDLALRLATDEEVTALVPTEGLSREKALATAKELAIVHGKDPAYIERAIRIHRPSPEQQIDDAKRFGLTYCSNTTLKNSKLGKIQEGTLKEIGEIIRANLPRVTVYYLSVGKESIHEGFFQSTTAFYHAETNWLWARMFGTGLLATIEMATRPHTDIKLYDSRFLAICEDKIKEIKKNSDIYGHVSTLRFYEIEGLDPWSK